METKINEHLVSIRATPAPIDKPLEMGQEVVIGAKGTVVKIEDKDMNDGTINRTFIIRVEYTEDYSVR